jgi:murein L,D-transpeptidase YafK
LGGGGKGLSKPLVALAAFLFASGCAASEPIDQTIDRILVEKQARRLTLLSNGKAVRSYRVSLGGNPVGHKREEGDERTPEGVYSITARNAYSSFYRSLQISYPNDQDEARAAAQGVDPGGLIMIHGIRNGLGWVGGLHRFLDWTDGCIAVTNGEMDEIWELVPIGTPIEIRP